MPLTRLPPGHVGTVVTYLAMTERPAAPLAPADLRIRGPVALDLAAYRNLFARVGGPWLWYSRLLMPDAELRASMGQVHLVEDEGGATIGFFELDFARRPTALIRFLGLVPAEAGRGRGRWLLGEVLRRVWADGITRVEVNTCTLDHPAALPNYLRAGFHAYARAFESFPDPRLAGLLPRYAAPHIPLVGSENTVSTPPPVNCA